MGPQPTRREVVQPIYLAMYCVLPPTDPRPQPIHAVELRLKLRTTFGWLRAKLRTFSHHLYQLGIGMYRYTGDAASTRRHASRHRIFPN